MMHVMKKKAFLIGFLMICLQITAASQVYLTRNGTIRFFSEAPLENIEALNRQVMSALNSETGEFVFRLPIRSFAFDKALMQEHFNDNFMESHKYPNASFQGEIENIRDIDFSRPGEVSVTVQGELSIKDVTKSIRESGTLHIYEDHLRAQAEFIIEPEKYDIRIPTRYVRNIASEIEVFVDVTLRPQ